MDKDYNGTSGFEILQKKLKDGRQMCKDVEEFLRARAKIEEDYAKQLHRLAKSAGGNTELGTLSTSWNAVKLQTEAISEEHMEAHQALLDAANRVSEFAERQKVVRKQEEETMKKSNKRKSELFKKMVDSKRSYEKNVREADSARDSAQRTPANSTVNPKDAEKLHRKAVATSSEAKKADESYKNAVETLETQRKQWEKDMTKTCEEFEKLEEVRIAWLRNELWVHTNILSQMCVDNDNHCEEIRKVLEKCDVDKDLTEFVERNKTGNDRPGKILYECAKGSYGRPPAPLPAGQRFA